MAKEKIIKYLPILFILGVWLVFIAPYLLMGKVPYPADYQVNAFTPWSMYEWMWGPVKNDAMSDIITQIYPWRIFSIQELASGSLPLWNPYSFAGTPHLANYQSAVLFPGNILFFIFPHVLAWSALVLLQPIIAAFGAYIFVRSQKVSKTGATISALSFMFCGFLTSWMGYATLGYAIVPLPYILYSVNKYYENKKTRHIIAISLLTTTSLFSGHFQTSLYLILATVAFIFWQYFHIRKWYLTQTLILAVLSGILLGMIQIVPTLELYAQSVRSTLYKAIETIPWSHLPTLVAPDFFGNPVSRNNYTGHYAEWNMYAGAIPLLLALFAAIKRKSPFFIFLFLLAILLAFTTPLSNLLPFLKIPVLSTSSQSRIIVLASFSIAVLSGFGIDELKEAIKKRSKKGLALYTLAAVILSLLLGISIFITDTHNKQIVLRNSILPLGALFLSTIIVWCTYYFKKYASFILCLLLLLTAGEMLRFSQKWMPEDQAKNVFPHAPVIEFYKNISPYRMFANVSAENSVFYRVPVLGGYDPLSPERYGEFVGYIGTGKLNPSERTTIQINAHGKYINEALDLLSAKYILHKKEDTGEVWAFPFALFPNDRFKKVYEDEEYEIYENTNVLPRALIFHEYLIENGDKDILQKLFNNTTEFRNRVVLEKDPGIKSINSSASAAHISYYKPNQIDISYKSNQDGILFLSDTYYPGWKAYVNGNESEILRANYAFRGVVIPEGSGSVQFIYKPESLVTGLLLSLLGVFILGFLILFNKKK